MSFGLYDPKIAWVVRSKTQKVQSKTARTVKCTTPKKYCPTIRLMPSEMYLHMPRTNRILILMSLRHPNVPLDFYHRSAHTGARTLHDPSKSQPNVTHQGARDCTIRVTGTHICTLTLPSKVQILMSHAVIG